MRCPNCKTGMTVTGYIQIVGNGKSCKIPAKWRCPRCGLRIDAM